MSQSKLTLKIYSLLRHFERCCFQKSNWMSLSNLKNDLQKLHHQNLLYSLRNYNEMSLNKLILFKHTRLHLTEQSFFQKSNKMSWNKLNFNQYPLLRNIYRCCFQKNNWMISNKLKKYLNSLHHHLNLLYCLKICNQMSLNRLSMKKYSQLRQTDRCCYQISNWMSLSRLNS